MEIFTVTEPGSMPKAADGSLDQDRLVLLHLLKHAYYDAMLALHYYSDAVNVLSAHMRSADRGALCNGIPTELLMRTPQLHARSFLFALDNFELALKAIKQSPDAPVELETILADFKSAFPQLRENRNTVHHLDERAQRLGANGRPNAAIGGLVLDGLSGNMYTNTLADGTHGSVEISRASMLSLQSLYQRVLDSLLWVHNHASVLPRIE
jgi:hypothetical protein